MTKWNVQKLTHRTSKNTYNIMTQQTFRITIFYLVSPVFGRFFHANEENISTLESRPVRSTANPRVKGSSRIEAVISSKEIGTRH